jgi:hypothetical protein
MAKKCPRGFVCTDWNTVFLYIALGVIVFLGGWFFMKGSMVAVGSQPPQIVVVPAAAPAVQHLQTTVRPDLYPEPVQRIGVGLPSIATRGPTSPYQQVGILTAEGGSAAAAAPDRTVLPLYGRELDSRRGKWNYYTRTDGANPVQVPVRVKNRICDDDNVGCDEVYSDDSVHVPVLGRSFNATVYRKSIFG